MLWGGIKVDVKTDLVEIRRRNSRGITGERYVNEIVDPHIRPLAENLGENFILAQDNAHSTHYCYLLSGTALFFYLFLMTGFHNNILTLATYKSTKIM